MRDVLGCDRRQSENYTRQLKAKDAEIQRRVRILTEQSKVIQQDRQTRGRSCLTNKVPVKTSRDGVRTGGGHCLSPAKPNAIISFGIMSNEVATSWGAIKHRAQHPFISKLPEDGSDHIKNCSSSLFQLGHFLTSSGYL